MTNSEFLSRVDCLISNKGVTRAEFYEKTETSASIYNKWRYRGNMPTLDVAKRIADYLEVTIDFLLDGKPESKENILSPEEKRLIEAWRQLPQDYRKFKLEEIEDRAEKNTDNIKNGTDDKRVPEEA